MKEGSFLCSKCLSKLTDLANPTILNRQPNFLSLHLDKLIYLYKYQEPISDLIILGKYSFIPDIFEILAMLSANLLYGNPECDMQNFILCPIPLSKQRFRWRGFNQSTIICQALSATLKIPYSNLILRNRNTKTQKDLSAKMRIKNIKGCFNINPKFQKSLKNRNVILIDDVATTGSTLNAAADTLKLGGANKIYGFVLAKD